MRPSKALYLSLLVFLVVSSAGPAQAQISGWVTVVPGIEFQEFQVPTPNNIFVARMDRSVPGLSLESSMAQGRLAGGTETIQNQAERYDQALNYWGPPVDPPVQSWGSRNRVVVAINGSGFSFNTGQPEGGQIHSGWYAKRFEDNGGTSGFAWKMDRSAFIGECVFHRPEKQVIQFLGSGGQQMISGINVERGKDELIVFTPQWNPTTGADDTGLEVLVEMERPTMIFPLPQFVLGRVREIRDQQGSTPIPFDHVVLSAHGTARDLLLASVNIGDEIGISQEISNCPGFSSPGWTKTYASVGGMSITDCGAIFLKDGEVLPCATNTREPRTAIAFNDKYIYYIVVDGRNPGVSVGMSMTELGIFASTTLTATWGINQDGGGSSTMWVNGVVVNNTYCNHTDCTPDESEPGLRPGTTRLESVLPVQEPVWRSGILPETGVRYDPLTATQGNQFSVFIPVTARSRKLQRLVANGMLMVMVEPMEQSTVFTTTQTVTTTAETIARLGPGGNYPSLATIPAGTSGVVLDHLGGLNGVLAKGTNWWKVDLGGIAGWVSEELLVGSLPALNKPVPPADEGSGPIFLPR